jgi:hypothetical protein
MTLEGGLVSLSESRLGMQQVPYPEDAPEKSQFARPGLRADEMLVSESDSSQL